MCLMGGYCHMRLRPHSHTHISVQAYCQTRLTDEWFKGKTDEDQAELKDRVQHGKMHLPENHDDQVCAPDPEPMLVCFLRRVGSVVPRFQCSGLLSPATVL